MFRAGIRAIRHELALKLVAILAAISLWLYVINTEDPFRTETYRAPVTVVSVPDGLDVVKTRPESVATRLHGRLSALERGALGAVTAVADLSSGKPGQNTVTLQVRGLSDRVSLQGLERPTANVWLDHRVAERFRVQPVVVGTPAEGCELLSDPVVEPAKVRVAGSASAIEDVAQVVVRIDITGLAQKQTVTRTVEALDDRRVPVSGVKLVPAEVAVELPIFQVTTKEVPVRARIGAPGAGFVVADVRPSPDTVTLKGTPDVLREVQEIKTEWQSIRDLYTTKAYRVPLVLPSGLWPVDDVRAVSVRVTVRPLRERPLEEEQTQEPQEAESGEPPGTDAAIVTPDGQPQESEEPDQGDPDSSAPPARPAAAPGQPTPAPTDPGR